MIKRFMQGTGESFIHHYVKEVEWQKYSKEIFFIFCMSALLIAGFFGMRWRNNTREAAAQKAFGECLQEYQRVLHEKNSRWEDVTSICDAGYHRHKSSMLAPLFLAICADALLMEGKQSEALAIIEQVVTELSVSHPLYLLYKTKRALMKLDSEETLVQQEGRQELQMLAHDSTNIYADQASYYVGYDYFIRGDKEQAQKEWHDLIGRFTTQDQRAPSPWALLAQKKLEKIQ